MRNVSNQLRTNEGAACLLGRHRVSVQHTVEGSESSCRRLLHQLSSVGGRPRPLASEGAHVDARRLVHQRRHEDDGDIWARSTLLRLKTCNHFSQSRRYKAGKWLQCCSSTEIPSSPIWDAKIIIMGRNDSSDRSRKGSGSSSRPRHDTIYPAPWSIWEWSDEHGKWYRAQEVAKGIQNPSLLAIIYAVTRSLTMYPRPF